MNELKNEIIALIDKLDKSNPIDASPEQITISHLNGLLLLLENTEDEGVLRERFAELEQFYASSVAWCSQLSKDIEKIIIMYQEQL